VYFPWRELNLPPIKADPRSDIVVGGVGKAHVLPLAPNRLATLDAPLLNVVCMRVEAFEEDARGRVCFPGTRFLSSYQ
jgi:hypothetical protein